MAANFSAGNLNISSLFWMLAIDLRVEDGLADTETQLKLPVQVKSVGRDYYSEHVSTRKRSKLKKLPIYTFLSAASRRNRTEMVP